MRAWRPVHWWTDSSSLVNVDDGWGCRSPARSAPNELGVVVHLGREMGNSRQVEEACLASRFGGAERALAPGGQGASRKAFFFVGEACSAELLVHLFTLPPLREGPLLGAAFL